MFKNIIKLYRRRKAISPVIATILIIAIVVAAIALIYVYLIPLFKTYRLEANILKISDTNKDSQYDRIQLQMTNYGTQMVEIENLTIWVCGASQLNNTEAWVALTDWYFENTNDKIVDPSEITQVYVKANTTQISLTIKEYTYYRLEIKYGAKEPFISEWGILNDYFDEVDLLRNFEFLELTADAFEGTIDDPRRDDNNYKTDGPASGGEYFLNETSYFNFLPVLDEDNVQFYISDKLMVMHSTEGNLTEQPLVQTLLPNVLFRASVFYILGLAGSWGWDIVGDWGLKLTITYTDNSVDEWEMAEDYIDDWWYDSNTPHECISAPYGKITEIDLGHQIDTPNEHIHTHTTKFMLDYFKYVQSVTFTDNGIDGSAAHIISLTFK
ncbi:MAG: type IV pilin [Asgard group archaeon]|nr:type IV pilin [Asgard group archaeon]